MPDCHLCPVNDHPTNQCLKCKGPSVNPVNHGQRIVSLDTMPPSEVAKLTYVPQDQESPLSEFMRHWLRLPPKSRDLISLAISEPPASCAELARLTGHSRQFVHRSLLDFASSCPEILSALRLSLRAANKQFKDNVDNNETKGIK
jgi:hypothetical protein